MIRISDPLSFFEYLDKNIVTTQAAVRFLDGFFRGTFGRHGRPASALAMASHGSMPFLVVVLR